MKQLITKENLWIAGGITLVTSLGIAYSKITKSRIDRQAGEYIEGLKKLLGLATVSLKDTPFLGRYYYKNEGRHFAQLPTKLAKQFARDISEAWVAWYDWSEPKKIYSILDKLQNPAHLSHVAKQYTLYSENGVSLRQDLLNKLNESQQATISTLISKLTT